MDTTEQPIRFATLCGAEVVVTPTGRSGCYSHQWECRGCDTTGTHNRDGARDKANTHAGQCRSLPRT